MAGRRVRILKFFGPSSRSPNSNFLKDGAVFYCKCSGTILKTAEIESFSARNANSGIYKLGTHSSTLPVKNIWLQHNPLTAKGTTVKVTGKEKEHKVKIPNLSIYPRTPYSDVQLLSYFICDKYPLI